MEEGEDRREAADDGNVLLLFGGALGDFLCLLPGLHALRRRASGRITIAAQPAFLELLDREDFGTLSVDRREVADLFSTGTLQTSTLELFRNFATAHSWIGHDDDNFATRLATATGGVVRIHRLRSMRAEEHASQYLARCLGMQPAPVSVVPPGEAVDWAADFWLRHGLNDLTLVVHPGSGSPTKNWHGMATIARRWQTQRQGPVLALGGPAEQSVDVPYDAIVREASLNRVAAILRQAAGYAGNDSGISHLAGLVGVRGVVTFGPSKPEIWHPLGGGLDVCRAESTTCPHCGPGQFCAHLLEPEAVWEALLRRTVASPSQTTCK